MKNHYDVLKLEKNCTDKEIKESFIKLSKKYHPDKNKSSDAHEKFVRVNEAYSVLGKSNSRLLYDEALAQGPNPHTKEEPFSARASSYPKYYEAAFTHRPVNNQEINNPYTKKIKVKAVIFCCMLMLLGAGLQMRHVWREKYRRDLYSQQIAKSLRDSREKMKGMTKEDIMLNFGKPGFMDDSLKKEK